MSKYLATELELQSSSYYNEDLYAENLWIEAHERDESRFIGGILADDALKHFDLIDKTDSE